MVILGKIIVTISFLIIDSLEKISVELV